MKKKLLALFLALTMAVSLVTPAFAAGGMVTSPSEVLASTPAGRAALLSAWDFEVFQKDDLDKAVEEATVNLFEKTQIMLGELDIPGVDFQWQIAVPDQDLWVDIQGEDKLGLDLSYAKVASLLNEDGEAQVRCEVSLGSLVFQGPIITVDVDEDAKPESEPVEEKEPVVLKGPEVVIHDSQPAEPEEPEAEEPAPEAPVVPPVQQEPEVVPEVVPEEPVVVPEEPATELDRSALEESVVAVYNHRAAPLTASTNLVATTNSENNPTYNVVINYVFENNEIVADPYTANLAAGSNFSATVNFPKVQGYLPYVGETQQNSIDLNYTAISQDDTINVVYKPTNVNYTVIHYKQNVGDDNYTEAERETKQGLTNSTVPEVHKKENGDPKYPGFYALLYERPEIAADGSTVVEVYYDRNYYLMNFDLSGGYGVEPIYARYGAPISVGTPTRAGYTFKGWSLDGKTIVDLPKTMPVPADGKKVTYKAVWKSDATAEVTIVFWGENADDEAYSYIKSEDVNIKPGTSFTYSPDASRICGQEEHTHGDACTVDCGLTVHDHDKNCYSLTCQKTDHSHTTECYTCRQESHTHGTDCYAGVGRQQNVYTDVPDRPVQGQVHEHWLYGDLIYINGAWYRYNGSVSSGSIAPVTCGKTEGSHEHTDSCLGCGEEAHTHTDYTGNCYALSCTTPVHTHNEACYACDKATHSHDESCYMSDAGLASNLWTFVRSDTVTVAADGSSVVNVYYDRTEFTLTFYDESKTVATIKDKWGADISNEFEKAPFTTTYNGRAWKCTDSNKYNYALQTLDRMPQFNATFNLYEQNSYTLKTIYYYLENVGANVSHTSWPKNTNNFTLLKTVDTYFNYATYEEEYHKIEGFTRYSKSDSGFGSDSQKDFSNNKMYLYYLRNDYILKFSDGYDVVKEETVQYEAPLSTYEEYVPPVPSAYEPGSVEFAGWYLDPSGTGDEFKLDENNMPLGNLIIYAKWVPVEHTVTFYLDRTAYDAGTKLTSHPDVKVAHGSTVKTVPAKPDNGDYSFIGWFYMDGDTEKAFDFENMPVNKDLQVYGKWSSNVLKNYTVYYKIQGTDTEIADPTTGSALAGNTKTFEALGGKDLYEDYQEGYFPLVKSHSLTLDINDTATKTYTFEYVQKQAVPYTVYYVTDNKDAKAAGEEIVLEGKTYYIVHAMKEVSNNRKAVVTEKFEPVSGMMPDAYQKRLVVDGSEGATNQIIFYYKEDAAHAYYKITHYTENLDGETWTEYASSQAVGDINKTYTAEPMSISGFKYDATVEGTVTSGKLTNQGLELKLYYTRNEYPYQVNYLEYGSGDVLATAKTGSGVYGDVISESAIFINNYTPVNTVQNPSSQTLTIRIEKSQTEAKLNIINFYYKETEIDIKYEVVGPNGCGSVDPESEKVKVLSGAAHGSTATASDGYKFVGWYDNEECTGTAVSTNAEFVPTKTQGTAWVDGTTYYAKFEYNLTSLTIKKTGCSTDDANQSFIFTVKGEGLPAEGMEVVVKGNGRVTIDGLKVGAEYTVTEDESWSWRYTPDAASKSKQLSATVANNTVTFENTKSNSNWLSGVCYAVNNWFNNEPVRGGD